MLWRCGRLCALRRRGRGCRPALRHLDQFSLHLPRQFASQSLHSVRIQCFTPRQLLDFLQTHPLYVVAIIATVIWLGIFIFLLRLDRRVKKLEKER